MNHIWGPLLYSQLKAVTFYVCYFLRCIIYLRVPDNAMLYTPLLGFVYMIKLSLEVAVYFNPIR